MRIALALMLTIGLASVAAAQSFEFEDEIAVKIEYRQPVRLLPGGKQMVWVDRVNANVDGVRQYAYFISDIDGKNMKKLYDSTLDWDDIFGFAFGRGSLSPSGKRFAVLTTHNGKPMRNDGSGRPVIDIISRDAKHPHRLKAELAMISSAVFVDEATLLFADHANPDERAKAESKLRQFSLKTGKYAELHHFEGGFVTCLQASPDGKRIAGIKARLDDPDSSDVWVYDVAPGKLIEQKVGRPDDTYFDDAIWLTWSGDSKHVFATVRAQTTGDMQLVRFSPDANEGERLKIMDLSDKAVGEAKPEEKPEPAGDQQKRIAALIQQLAAPKFADREAAASALARIGAPALPALKKARRSDDAETALRAEQIINKIKGVPEAVPGQMRQRILTAGTLGDDWISVVRRGAQGYEGLAVHITNGKVVKLDKPILVIGREGDRVLLCDLTDRQVSTATVKSTQ